MIVRISGEGQWRLADGAVELVNEKDNAAVDAVSAGDEAAFGAAFSALLGPCASRASRWKTTTSRRPT